jgi:hypothetical protein
VVLATTGFLAAMNLMGLVQAIAFEVKLATIALTAQVGLILSAVAMVTIR